MEPPRGPKLTLPEAARALRDLETPGRFLDCISLMILPQVHLRKPCYDFYFL